MQLVEQFLGSTVKLFPVDDAEAAPGQKGVKAVCPGPAPCPASFGDAAGIDNWSTMTLIDSTVSDNHAPALLAA